MRADLVQGLREAVCGVERLPGRFVVAGFGSAGSVAFGLGLMGLPVSAAGATFVPSQNDPDSNREASFFSGSATLQHTVASPIVAELGEVELMLDGGVRWSGRMPEQGKVGIGMTIAIQIEIR